MWYLCMLGHTKASGILMHWGGFRVKLWLTFLSFQMGLWCQVAVTPYAQWGPMRQRDQWESGVWSGTKWSPVSVGIVREAWDWWGGDERWRCQGTDSHWALDQLKRPTREDGGPSPPHLFGMFWRGETGERENMGKGQDCSPSVSLNKTLRVYCSRLPHPGGWLSTGLRVWMHARHCEPTPSFCYLKAKMCALLWWIVSQDWFGCLKGVTFCVTTPMLDLTRIPDTQQNIGISSLRSWWTIAQLIVSTETNWKPAQTLSFIITKMAILHYKKLTGIMPISAECGCALCVLMGDWKPI